MRMIGNVMPDPPMPAGLNALRYQRVGSGCDGGCGLAR